MQLTKKQEEGLRIAVQRYRNREKCTVISGYAGLTKLITRHKIKVTTNILEKILITRFSGLIFFTSLLK